MGSLSKIKGVIRRTARTVLRQDCNRFLGNVSGVIHVGANTGQESAIYAEQDLDVIWIEPIPDVFEILKTNIKAYPRQKALRYLVTDKDDTEYQFHIANNSGQSSSILPLNQHKDIWPDIHYECTVRLRSITLASLIKKEAIPVDRFQALVMDTQGSELLVLQGAQSILRKFKFIKTEVADFESYTGCCKVEDLSTFMEAHGFKRSARYRFATRAQGGNYYDMLYERKS